MYPMSRHHYGGPAVATGQVGGTSGSHFTLFRGDKLFSRPSRCREQFTSAFLLLNFLWAFWQAGPYWRFSPKIVLGFGDLSSARVLS
jgi:hypothetical protein